MAFNQTLLSFDIVDTNNITTIGLMDTSIYQEGASGFALQVIIPGYTAEDAVELSYYPGGVIILNSNNLKLTNVTYPSLYQELPDGLWTVKISVCPFPTNWFEKSWYRTAVLECKFYKAFLQLELNICTSCYNSNKKEKLDLVWTYIQGVHANVSSGNYRQATALYNIALELVDKLLDCEGCN